MKNLLKQEHIRYGEARFRDTELVEPFVNRIWEDIYETFENKVCENCKYLIGKDKTAKCIKGYLPDNLYEYEFGCTKFMKKQ